MLTAAQARYISLVAVVLALLFCLQFGLLGALLAGLLVHEIVHAIAPRLAYGRGGTARGRMLGVGLLATLVIGALVALGFGAAALFRMEGASPAELLARMADILASARVSMPEWIGQHLPADTDELSRTIADWLRGHARELQNAGKWFGVALAHILIGMVIGAMVCLREARGKDDPKPLQRETNERLRTLAQAFRGVVFAQVKISAVNTFFTGLYLAVVLPLLGVNLPFTKSIIAVTFLGGLLPIVGNLISNTVIVIVSLSVSFGVAVSSLAFLVIVHKLEYFLNARIVGGEVKCAAWELLCAMLVFEAAFGLPGVVAAPIFYAYIKEELIRLGVI